MNSRWAQIRLAVLITLTLPGAGASVAQGRSLLRADEFLSVGQYLVSHNRAFYVMLQGDGNLVVYKGSGPEDNYGFVWHTDPHGDGSYFAIQQGDGNFVVYKGSGPGDNQGWAWGTQRTTTGGKAFLTLQDDGNLCSYSGDEPSDAGRLWCSMVTPEITWIPDGKRIRSAYNIADLYLYYGESGSPARLGTWVKASALQKWAFLEDGTLRLASNSTLCLSVGRTDAILTVPCNQPEGVTHWEYRARDHRILKTNTTDGCMYLAGPPFLPVYFPPGCGPDEPRKHSQWFLE